MTIPLDVLVTPMTGGTLTVVAADGVVVAAGYDGDVVARIPGAFRSRGTRDVERIDGVSDAIEAYVAGDIGALDSVPVDQPGGEFMQGGSGGRRAGAPRPTR